LFISQKKSAGGRRERLRCGDFLSGDDWTDEKSRHLTGKNITKKENPA
jgi:hypothetical protein